MTDTVGGATFVGTPAYGSLTKSGGPLLKAIGFAEVDATDNAPAKAAADIAQFYDSTGNDTFAAQQNQASLSGPGYILKAAKFVTAQAWSTAGGIDTATLTGTTAADTFTGSPDSATLKANSNAYTFTANSFENVYAFGGGGTGADTATLTGSAAAGVTNTFAGTLLADKKTTRGLMSDRGYNNGALAADIKNTAKLGSQIFTSGGSYMMDVQGFKTLTANQATGHTGDVAKFFDSALADVFTANPTVSTLASGSVYKFTANNFSAVEATSSDTKDTANLKDSALTDDRLTIASNQVTLANATNWSLSAKNFKSVHAQLFDTKNKKQPKNHRSGNTTVYKPMIGTKPISGAKLTLDQGTSWWLL